MTAWTPLQNLQGLTGMTPEQVMDTSEASFRTWYAALQAAVADLVAEQGGEE